MLPTQLWDGLDTEVERQGAIVCTDAIWRAGKALGKGPAVVIVVQNYPKSLKGKANGTELVTYLGALQLGTTLVGEEDVATPPAIEVDCKSIITRGMKEYNRYGTRSLNCRTHGYLYQYARRVNRQWPRGVRRWIRSHPERRTGIGQYTGPDARIMVADAYAGSCDAQRTTEQLQAVKFKDCRYEVAPEIVIKVDAPDILQAAYSTGDFYWAQGPEGCPTSSPLQVSDLQDLSRYLSERSEYAAKGSNFPWHLSRVGLLSHMWGQAKQFKRGWEQRAAVQDLWDKRDHGRNQHKERPNEAPPPCALCQQQVDSQAHYSLRCSHPLMKLARSGFFEHVSARIAGEASGPGKEYLLTRWTWVMTTPPVEESLLEGMHQMAFVLGRPTPYSLDCEQGKTKLSKTERENSMNCITDLWHTSLKYLRHLWSLRSSILAAPLTVQERLRTTPATLSDLRGMLQHPYSQRDRRQRSLAMRTTLARFCERNDVPPPAPPMADSARGSVCEPGASSQVTREDESTPEWLGQWLVWMEQAGKPRVKEIPLGEQCEEAQDADLPMESPVRRRNPARRARPPTDIDLSDWGFFVTPGVECGQIKASEVNRIKMSQGPNHLPHSDDYLYLWVRPSELCSGGNLGLFLEVMESGLRRGHLIAVYDGESCDSLGILYLDALKLWEDSEYVLSQPKAQYAVNGASTCSAARANDSFGDANAFLYFNERLRRFELRLAIDLPAGFYEILVNYTEPHRRSSFWTAEAIARLPKETQQRARSFYSEP